MREADFPEEPLRAEERSREFGVKHLERHRPVVSEIAREIDRGHATTADLALKRVAIGQRRLEPFRGLAQRELPDWGISRLSPTIAPCRTQRAGVAFGPRFHTTWEPQERVRFCYNFFTDPPLSPAFPDRSA